MLEKNTRLEILSLTGLRLIAAFLVCIAHSIPKVIPSEYNAEFGALSAEGMTLFFVLSGFVIHYNYSYSIKK